MAAAGVDDEEKGAMRLQRRNNHIVDRYHLVYLYSWPLISRMGGRAPKEIQRLDFEGEKSLLESTLHDSKRQIQMCTAVATSDNLLSLKTLGFRAIHYTGHGEKGYLCFEDGKGAMHAMDTETLRNVVCPTGNDDQKVKFVFVSACYSEEAGNAFVQAGVPHVIAVKLDSQVADKVSKVFMKHFYLALFVGRTVQQAFESGQKGVLADPHIRKLDDSKKFLLLPAHGKHDVPIFDDVPQGDWQDCSDTLAPNNLWAVPEKFMGRNMELQTIIAKVDEKRLISITGPSGIGKTALAKAAAYYIWERRMSPHGVFFINCANAVPVIQTTIQQAENQAAAAGGAGGGGGGGGGSGRSTPSTTGSTGGGGGGGSGDDMSSSSSPSTPSCIAVTVTSVSQNIFAHLIAREKIGFDDIRTHSDLYQAMKVKKVMLVLDGINVLCAILGTDYVKSVLQNMLAQCPHLRVIITSEREIGIRDNVAEFNFQLQQLSPTVSAKLFWALLPRKMLHSEFKCTNQENAVSDLARHEVLVALAGHPRRLIKAVDLLKLHEMSTMMPGIRKQEAEEEARQARENQVHEHLRSQLLSLSQSLDHRSHQHHSHHHHHQSHGGGGGFTSAMGSMSLHGANVSPATNGNGNGNGNGNASGSGSGDDPFNPIKPQRTQSHMPSHQHQHQHQHSATVHGSHPSLHHSNSVGSMSATALHHNNSSGINNNGGSSQSQMMHHQQHHHPHSQSMGTPSGGGGGGGGVAQGSSVVSLAPEGHTYSYEECERMYISDERGRQWWRQHCGRESYCPWAKFQQSLQSHFGTVTQQHVRPLTQQWLVSISNRLQLDGAMEHSVSMVAFGRFWPWWAAFVAAVHKIRDMWIVQEPFYVVYGLISRQQSAAMLSGKPVGTFLLRFSESKAGCIAGSFVDDDGETISHTLINCFHGRGDGGYAFSIFLSDGELAYATLTELILKCRKFRYLYPGTDKTIAFSHGDDGDVPH